MGETLDNAIFGINVIASQTISDNEVEVGDSYTIEVHIDMPGITVEDRSDLVVEVFAVRPDQGTLHLRFIFFISIYIHLTFFKMQRLAGSTCVRLRRNTWGTI